MANIGIRPVASLRTGLPKKGHAWSDDESKRRKSHGGICGSQLVDLDGKRDSGLKRENSPRVSSRGANRMDLDIACLGRHNRPRLSLAA